MTEAGNDPVLEEFARKAIGDAFMEGVRNGRENRSHPSQRPPQPRGAMADLERNAYAIGWHHGRSLSPADSTDLARENVIDDLLGTEPNGANSGDKPG